MKEMLAAATAPVSQSLVTTDDLMATARDLKADDAVDAARCSHC